MWAGLDGTARYLARSFGRTIPERRVVRYAVIDGKERDRVEVPLPINLQRDTDYNVKVSVRGGELSVNWRAAREPVWLTGPAEVSFEGKVEV